MNRIILCTFIMLFGIAPTLQLSAQEKYTTNYQIKYVVTYHIDSLHREQKDNASLFSYTGSKYGVFTNYDVIAMEKTMKELENKYGQNAASFNVSFSKNLRNSSFNKTFYKDLHSGRIKTVVSLAGKDYVFDEPKNNYKWEMEDSTKTIKGYTVQKATTYFAGRNYVAWFTMEVPIHDGPYLFSGLPGLIVKLYDTEKDYVFELESLQKLDDPKVWTISKNAKPIVKAELKKMRRKINKNALLSSDFKYLMSHTPGVDGTFATTSAGKVISAEFKKNGKKITKNELRRLYKENQERQNNPIELN